jgi:OOP family OmpA-OmpF porin
VSGRGTTRVAGIAITVALLGLGLGRVSAAQGTYLGAAWSHAAVNETVIDDTKNAYKLVLGYEFEPFLGIEVGWVDFGEFDGVITAAGGSTRVGYDAKTATAAITGRLPIRDLAALYAKAGYMFWSTDVKLTGTVSDPQFVEGKDNGRDPFYGGGLRINLGKWAVFGEWERYKLSEIDIDAISAGVRITF